MKSFPQYTLKTSCFLTSNAKIKLRHSIGQEHEPNRYKKLSNSLGTSEKTVEIIHTQMLKNWKTIEEMYEFYKDSGGQEDNIDNYKDIILTLVNYSRGIIEFTN